MDTPSRFRLETRVVDGDHGVVGAMASFLASGTADEDRIAVAGPRRLARLRRRVGRDAPVMWWPYPLSASRPGIAFDDLRRFLESPARRGRPIRAALDLDGAGRPDRERRAVLRWTAMAPAALAGVDATVLAVRSAGDERLRTVAPRPALAREAMPLASAWELRDVRSAVLDAADRAGLAIEAAEDFRMAVNEIAANALWHARGPVVVRVGRDEDALVVEVTDSGPGLDPRVAHLPPVAPEQGRGLWIAHQLADVVEVIPEGAGTRVRLEVGIGLPTPPAAAP